MVPLVRCLPFFPTFVLVLSIAGCSKTPQEDIEARGYPFNSDGFVSAVREGDAVLTDLYLKGGINPDSRDNRGVPALSYVIQQDDLPTLQQLIQAGTNLDVPVANGKMTALMLAAREGYLELTVALAAGGADVNIRDEFGNTSLLLGATSGRPEIVQTLLDAGADPGRNTLRGITPLMAGAMKGSASITRLLVGAGVRLDSRDFDNGMAALSMAASVGASETVSILLEAGADPNVIDNRGQNPLSHAVGMGHVETVRAFLKAGVHPDIMGPNRQSALSWAVLKGAHEIVGLLLESGADPNQPDAEGLLPLQIANGRGDRRMLALLERFGASSDLGVALKAISLLQTRPPSAPASWAMADPFNDQTPYYQSYSLLSTTFTPPLTRRMLLRGTIDEQSQLFVVLGRTEDWQARIDKSRKEIGLAEEIESGLIPVADLFLVNSEIRRTPPGLLGGKDITHFFGHARCGEWSLIIDAGGLTEQFDWELVEQIVGEIDLRPVLDCPAL